MAAVNPSPPDEEIARAQRGDPAARAAVVERYLPQVEAAARTYRASTTVPRTDLIQEGVVGLLRALERFEPGRGVPFWAYASWWVRQAMQQVVSELTGPVVLSDRALRHLARLKDANRAALDEHGRQPGRDELARRADLAPEAVDDLLAVSRAPRSLDEPVEGEDGRVGTFGELVADPLAAEAYEELLEALHTEEVLGLLGSLSEREREILDARYGLEGREEEGLRDLGARMGLSGERVRQLEQRALGKLRQAAAG